MCSTGNIGEVERRSPSWKHAICGWPPCGEWRLVGERCGGLAADLVQPQRSTHLHRPWLEQGKWIRRPVPEFANWRHAIFPGYVLPPCCPVGWDRFAWFQSHESTIPAISHSTQIDPSRRTSCFRSLSFFFLPVSSRMQQPHCFPNCIVPSPSHDAPTDRPTQMR